MKSVALRFAPMLLLAVAAGCSSHPKAGSCVLYDGMACMSFTGKVYADNPAATKSSCAALPAAQKPVFSGSACPSKDEIGACAHYAGTADEIVTHYYSKRSDMHTIVDSTAQETCGKSGGHWQPVAPATDESAKKTAPPGSAKGDASSDRKSGGAKK